MVVHNERVRGYDLMIRVVSIGTCGTMLILDLDHGSTIDLTEIASRTR